MVVMDATTLLLLFFPSAKPPLDEKTKEPVEKCKERIELLLENLSKAGIRVMVPTPVLSEILVKAGADKAKVLNEISNSSAFKIQPFDEAAAVEISMLPDADLQSNKALTDIETKAKVKYDRQIVAIAKVAGVKTIYSDDGKLRAKAQACGITGVSTAELQLPPTPPQGKLELVVPPETTQAEAVKDATPEAARKNSNDASSVGGGRTAPDAANAPNAAQAKGGGEAKS